MQERDSSEQLRRVSTRLDPEAPVPLARTDCPEEPGLAGCRAGEIVVPPEERSIESPLVAASDVQSVVLPDDRPHGRRPDDNAASAHDKAKTTNDPLRPNDPHLARRGVHDAGVAPTRLQPQHRSSGVFIVGFRVSWNRKHRRPPHRLRFDSGVVPAVDIVQPNGGQGVLHGSGRFVRQRASTQPVTHVYIGDQGKTSSLVEAMRRIMRCTSRHRPPHGDGFGRRTPLEHAASVRSRNARGAIPRADFRACDP